MDLPDLNVWFALVLREHPFHPRARAYWGQAQNPSFNRTTALGLLRLLTNPKAMDGKPLEVGEAWTLYREARLAGVPSWRSLRGWKKPWRPWCGKASPRLWTDAYLAAFARAGGHRLVTFDRDFLRFPGVQVLLLET